MNKRLLALLLATASSMMAFIESPFNPDSGCECKATSKTFFSARPAYQLNSPEFLASIHDRLGARGKECRNGFFDVTVFGGSSTKSRNFAQYFMFDCNQVLHVTEADLPTTDVLANQLNIYTRGGVDADVQIPAFDGYIQFKPRYSFGGVGLTYQHEFAHRSDGRSFWFLATTPITKVKTNMNLTERIIQNGGGIDPIFNSAVPQGVVGTVTQAFAQPGWCFGKIIPCESNNVTKLGDITLLLGYEILQHDFCRGDGYVGIIIPTGNKVRGQKVFEPIVGHNHHFGILTGTSGSLVVWECDDRLLTFEMDGHIQYMFKRCETRSFDLKNKPWSRYMQVYANQEQAAAAFSLANLSSTPVQLAQGIALATPGINVFTQPLIVDPGFAFINNIALTYTACDMQYELGYNFYARQAECVTLARPWQEGPALKSLIGFGTTDSVQLIGDTYNNNNAVEFETGGRINYGDNLIQANDLDLSSAEHPAVLSNTIYAAASYRRDDREHPTFVGIGGSYEFENDNTTMNRWMIWFKGGVSF